MQALTDNRPALARALVTGLVLMGLAVTELVAQTAPETLTLEEAIRMASRNNPVFLSTRNDMAAADWRVREAYGAFLPSVSTSAGLQYTDAGVQRFGNFTGGDIGAGTTDYYVSDYSLTLNYQLSGSTLFGARSARADQRATDARIDAAEFNLGQQVALQYMTALRARDAAEVARRQHERSRENFDIAQARWQAGAVPATEAKQAEVELGRAEAEVLRQEALLRAEKLRLFERLGVAMESDVELTSAFEVFEPDWTRDELLSVAMEGHPTLEAFRASESARVADVRQATSAYFPSLSAFAQWSGFTRQIGNESYLLGQARQSVQGARDNCVFMNTIAQRLPEAVPGYEIDDCSAYQLTSAEERQLVSSNDVFPFNFTKQPLALGLRISFPLFNGFSRQRQYEQAEALADDARHNRRAEELRLRTAVTDAYDQVVTAHRLVQIEERNVQVATEQLTLARERYRLGAANFLELLDAESSMQTAERDYLNAVYSFHQNLVALEAATGVQLRPESEGGDGA